MPSAFSMLLVAFFGIPLTVGSPHDASEVPVLPPGFEGPVTVSVGVDAAARPARLMIVEGEALTFEGSPFGALRVEVRTPLGGGVSTVRVEAAGPAVQRLTAEATVDTARRGSPRARIHAEATGLELSLLSAFFPSLALGGPGDVVLDVSGRLEAPRIDLGIASEALTWRGEAMGRVRGTLAHSGAWTDVTVRWGDPQDPHGVFGLGAPLAIDLFRLRTTWVDRGPHRLEFALRGIDAARLRPFWRAPPAADFDVDIVGAGRGHLGAFLFEMEVMGTLKDGPRPALPLAGYLRLEPDRQVIFARAGRGMLEGQLETRIPIPAVYRDNAALGPAAVLGTLRARVPLETVGPYLPSALYQPTGRVLGDVTVEGTLANPNVQGGFATEDAEVTLAPLYTRLSEIAAEVTFSGQSATLDRFEARVGRGRISGKGGTAMVVTPDGYDERAEDAEGRTGLWGAWSQAGDLSLELSGFPVVRPEFPLGVADGRIDATHRAAPDETHIAVEVAESRVRLTNKRLMPARAIARNARIGYHDWTGAVRAADSVFAGEGTLTVDLALKDPIDIRGDRTGLQMEGRMRIERVDDVAKVDGGFDVLSGHFELFDNPFELREGRIYMLGGDLGADTGDAERREASIRRDPDRPETALPLEPVVDFTSSGYVVDTDVLVKVEGPFRRPELVLASNPSLPEYQILTLLVTGRVDAVDERNGDVRRQVEQLANRFHNPSLKRQLFDRLGVDNLGVGFGSSVDQPIVTVGKQLTREVYVETTYHHNAPPDENGKEALVEYRFVPRWSVETVYGDAAEGRFNLWWRNQWGRPAKPAAPGWFERQQGAGSE